MRRFLLALFTLFCLNGFSQLNYQAVNAVVASGTYTDLGTTGTALTTTDFDDSYSAVTPIGFTFTFNGQAFTDFVLNTNGFIKLGNTVPASAAIYDPISSTEANLIYGIGFDLDGSAGAGTEYRVATTGAVGSRVTTIQYKNVKDYSATTGQFATMNFQIKLYETSNNVEVVIGNFTATAAAAAFIGTHLGVKGSAAANSVNATKASATAWSGATFVDGNYTGNKFNIRNNVLPTSGQTYRFVAVALPPNDAQVQALYVNGKTPVPSGNPNVIRVTVRNAGSATLNNLNVTLSVTGANTFNNVKTVTTLAAGATTVVSFDPFSPTALGNNTVTVSVPADDVNTNNSATTTMVTTANVFSTKLEASATGVTGGVGVNGNTADFAIKFLNASANTITSVTTYFAVAGASYTVSLYDGSGTNPGASLWTSTAQTATAGANTVTVPNIAVAGNFFVGINQTATTNLQYGFETENPIRSGQFYLRVPATTGTWTDFAPGNNFRLMVDAALGSSLPVSLVKFEGTRLVNANKLSWETSTEINSRGFELERSADGRNFSAIATINTKAEGGNSTTSLYYSYADERPIAGTNYYRLKQVDNDGKFSHSSVVVLKGEKTYNISAVYPNPVKETVYVAISSTKAGRANIAITDLAGRIIKQIAVNLIEGENNLPLNVNGLASGSYSIRLIMNDEVKTAQFIKN